MAAKNIVDKGTMNCALKAFIDVAEFTFSVADVWEYYETRKNGGYVPFSALQCINFLDRYEAHTSEHYRN